MLMPLQQKSITHFASLSELSTVCDAKNSSSRFFKFKTVILILKPPISYSFCFIKCRTAFMYNKKKSVNSSYFCISLVRTHQYSSGRVSESEWVSEKRLKKMRWWDGGLCDWPNVLLHGFNENKILEMICCCCFRYISI